VRDEFTGQEPFSSAGDESPAPVQAQVQLHVPQRVPVQSELKLAQVQAELVGAGSLLDTRRQVQAVLSEAKPHIDANFSDNQTLPEEHEEEQWVRIKGKSMRKGSAQHKAALAEMNEVGTSAGAKAGWENRKGKKLDPPLGQLKNDHLVSPDFSRMNKQNKEFIDMKKAGLRPQAETELYKPRVHTGRFISQGKSHRPVQATEVGTSAGAKAGWEGRRRAQKPEGKKDEERVHSLVLDELNKSGFKQDGPPGFMHGKDPAAVYDYRKDEGDNTHQISMVVGTGGIKQWDAYKNGEKIASGKDSISLGVHVSKGRNEGGM
jgi:hypothetical protein